MSLRASLFLAGCGVRSSLLDERFAFLHLSDKLFSMVDNFAVEGLLNTSHLSCDNLIKWGILSIDLSHALLLFFRGLSHGRLAASCSKNIFFIDLSHFVQPTHLVVISGDRASIENVSNIAAHQLVDLEV